MIGAMLGSYRIVDELGSGGMGKVYAAEHAVIGRRAAVKVLLSRYSDDKAMVERFFNEAKAANRIKHAGIVDVFECGFTDDGRAYILMELLEGESLHDRIKHRRKLPEEEVLRLCRQIASALHAAHDAGIVHRDLKPDNVYVVPDIEVPGGERVKVLDFGIAKLTGDFQRSASKTSTGMILGSPLYMSPEQCSGGGKDVDRRSDIYALGCVMYHMTCGRPPFVGQGGGQIIAQHIYETPRPVSYYEPAVRPEVEAVIMHALAKEPGHRYPSMLEVVCALDSVGAVGATSPRLAAHPSARPVAALPPTLELAARPSGSIPRTERVATGHAGLPQQPSQPQPQRASPVIPPASGAVTRRVGHADSAPDYPSPTTLGSAASQITGADGTRRRGKLWLALALVALMAGGAALAVGWSGSVIDTTAATGDPRPADAGTGDPAVTDDPGDGAHGRDGADPARRPDAPRDEVARRDGSEDGEPAPLDSPPGPQGDPPDPGTPAEAVETVVFRITSRPSKALVRDGDGKLLGETPLEVRVPRNREKARFRVETPGFRDQEFALLASRDRDKHVKLRRARKSGKKPPSKRPPRDPTGDPTEHPTPDDDGDDDRDWGKPTNPFEQ